MFISAQEEMQRILDDAVLKKVTPGLSASIFTLDEEFSWDFFSGKLDPNLSYEVDKNTVYDLASLSKVISTTLLSALAIDLGKMSLEETPWGEWAGISIAHILSHTSGLPAWKPFYRHALSKGKMCTEEGKKIVVKAALSTKPIAKPGEETLYSDIGFIALGDLLERKLDECLDVLFNEVSKKYFGKNSLRYRPITKQGFSGFKTKTASTGRNPWLKHAFEGYVHDPNCYAMGGVSGHAGLFGNLGDVKKAVIFFLKVLKENNLGIGAVLKKFAKHQGNRALGFDRPSLEGTTVNCLSPDSIGHLGFTGTSFWVDPNGKNGQGTAYVFLSNRVYYGTLSSEAIKKLRQSFHRAAFIMLEKKLPSSHF